MTSIDGSAHLLLEIAGFLYAGRLDRDVGTMARAPHSHPDVGAAVQEFAKLADEPYQQLVLLFTALSTKLRATGQAYVEVDEKARADLDRILAAVPDIPPQGR